MTAGPRMLDFHRRIPVRHCVDVFVAGGGPAGFAAACAAAEQGAEVLVAENQICFGGMGTAAGIPMFCDMTDHVNFVADGIGRRVHDRLYDMNGNSVSRRGDHVVYFNPEVLKRVYDTLAHDAGFVFSFQTRIIGIEHADGHLTHAICNGKSGLYAVAARAFVDATGDGDLCAWAGAPFEKGDAQGLMQPGTLVSTWSGIDWAAARAAGNGLWQQKGRLREAIADGVFTVPDPSLPGIIPTGRHSGNANMGHLFGIDGTDERSLTREAVHGRAMLSEYERYFKTYLTGYEHMELVGTGAAIGIRETRRILGDYRLVYEDYARRAVFDDEIGRFSYGVDLHATTLDKSDESAEAFKNQGLKPGENYGIPYRCLTPRNLDNTLVAGRCVSTDRAVQGSLRVMPGCFITGQAAGVAAAMVAARQTDTRSIDVGALQAKLLKLGAYLPHCNTDT